MTAADILQVSKNIKEAMLVFLPACSNLRIQKEVCRLAAIHCDHAVVMQTEDALFWYETGTGLERGQAYFHTMGETFGTNLCSQLGVKCFPDLDLLNADIIAWKVNLMCVRENPV